MQRSTSPQSQEVTEEVLAEIQRRPESVFCRSRGASFHLHFSARHRRFVALKLYPMEFFADGSFIGKFEKQAARVREHFTGGIAFPLEEGYQGGRLYQLTELMPGHPLDRLIRGPRRLSGTTVVQLCHFILEQSLATARQHGVDPVLDPALIFLQCGGEDELSAGFGDYDLRPERVGIGESTQQHRCEEVASLLYHVASGLGITRKELRELVRDGRRLEIEVGRELAPLFRRLLPPNPRSAPPDMAAVLELLEEVSGEEPESLELTRSGLDGVFLKWMPRTRALPDRFEYEQRICTAEVPSSYRVRDRVRVGSKLAHILPPESVTRGVLGPLFHQAAMMANGRPIEGFTRIDSVMQDRECLVVSEPSGQGMFLPEFLEKRGALDGVEVLNLLEKLHATLTGLERAGAIVPEVQLGDVAVCGVDGQNEIVFDDEFRLSNATDFQVRIRPVSTNLLFRDLPSLSVMGDLPEVGEREKVLCAVHEPEFGFLRLALQLMARTAAFYSKAGEELRSSLQRGFLTGSPESAGARETLLNRISRALEVTPGREMTRPGLPGLSRLPQIAGAGAGRVAQLIPKNATVAIVGLLVAGLAMAAALANLSSQPVEASAPRAEALGVMVTP